MPVGPGSSTSLVQIGPAQRVAQSACAAVSGAARHLVAMSLRRCLTGTIVQQRTYVLGQLQAENKQMQTMRAAIAFTPAWVKL